MEALQMSIHEYVLKIYSRPCITGAVQSMCPGHVAACAYAELEYHLDVCRIANGIHTGQLL